MDKERIALVKSIYETVQNGVTKTEFLASLKSVVDSVNEFKRTSLEAIATIKDSVTTALATLASKNEAAIAKLEIETRNRLNEQLMAQNKAITVKLEAVDNRISTLKNGEDGISPDPEEIKAQVLAEIVLPAQKELLLDTPEDIRNKLELLQGDERLDAKYIKGIEERLAALEKRPVYTGGGIVGRDIVQDYDLSSQLDGVTKTFNIPAVWNILSVTLSSYPTVLRKGVDYTWTPTSITFTSQIDAASTLAAGQTCVLTIVTA